MKEGVLVYMKNVHVRNPEFSLDCTGPLKIYMQYVEKKGKKKPSDRKKEEGKEIDKSGPVRRPEIIRSEIPNSSS